MAKTMLKLEVKQDVGGQKDFIVEVCREILNLPPDKLLNAVVTTQDGSDLNNFRLGGILERIEDEKLWTADGSKSFPDWVLRNLGFRSAKARYLIGIHANLRDADIPWERIKCLGWTRLRHLSGVLTQDNVDEWVQKAKDLTVLQLQEEVAKSKAGASSVESSPVTTMTFKVHQDQKDVIRQALDLVKKKIDTQFDAVALEATCLHYLSGGHDKIASLSSVMRVHPPEQVLATFGKLWPGIDVTATTP